MCINQVNTFADKNTTTHFSALYNFTDLFVTPYNPLTKK